MGPLRDPVWHSLMKLAAAPSVTTTGTIPSCEVIDSKRRYIRLSEQCVVCVPKALYGALIFSIRFKNHPSRMVDRLTRTPYFIIKQNDVGLVLPAWRESR
jgi:hypothetical protein